MARITAPLRDRRSPSEGLRAAFLYGMRVVRPTDRKRSIIALTWSATSSVLKWPASSVLAVTNCGQSSRNRSRSRHLHQGHVG